MPYIHTRSFRCRHYECDAYGRLSPAAYLGYMQETAFDASAAVGYGAARYAEIGYQWLAYETDITYLRPLHYGDTVEIKTWVVDFRRVRSLRNYEFYRDGKLVAHATTDWVLIDTRAMYPAAIPPEIIAAYSQGEAVIPAPPRPPFPLTPPVPSNAFTLTRRVEWRDIDPAIHVNNAVYLHYAADAELQALRTFGWTSANLRDSDAAILAQRYQIEYKFAATLDDEIILTTWVSQVEAAGGLRHTLVHRAADRKLLAKVQSEWRWGSAASGDAMLLPDTLAAQLLER